LFCESLKEESIFADIFDHNTFNVFVLKIEPEGGATFSGFVFLFYQDVFFFISIFFLKFQNQTN